MTWPDRVLAWAEGLDEQIGGADRDIQQRALARGLVMRNGGFIQVTQVVQLVTVVALELPPLSTGPRMRARGIDGSGRVEIAVLLLGGRNLLDQRVDIRVELRIGVDAQRVRRSLDHLVEIGIVERIAGGLGVPERLTAQSLRGADEVVDPAAQLALLERKRDRLDAVRLDPRRPEPVVQMDRREGNRLDGIIT